MQRLFIFLFLLINYSSVNAQVGFLASIATGYNFPKITHDGEPVPSQLYNPAISYNLGLRPYYKLNETIDFNLDLAFQTFAYKQRYYSGTFQHSGLVGGISLTIHRKRLAVDLGTQYVYVTHKTFGDPYGYANPNFFQASTGLQYNWKKFGSFLRFDYGLTEFHKYELTLVQDKFRRLYSRKLSIGVTYKIK